MQPWIYIYVKWNIGSILDKILLVKFIHYSTNLGIYLHI